MARSASGKEKRHKLLREKLSAQPFLTDGELADQLSVSIPTIRLDRLTLGIPELRERLRNVAATSFEKMRSLGKDDFSGVLVDIEPGVKGISIMDTTKEMCFDGTDVIKGHYIYSMAECLAVTVTGAKAALIDVGNIKYKLPVNAGTRLVARGEVRKERSDTFIVWVKIYDRQFESFRGKFIINTKLVSQTIGGLTGAGSLQK